MDLRGAWRDSTRGRSTEFSQAQRNSSELSAEVCGSWRPRQSMIEFDGAPHAYQSLAEPDQTVRQVIKRLLSSAIKGGVKIEGDVKG